MTGKTYDMGKKMTKSEKFEKEQKEVAEKVAKMKALPTKHQKQEKQEVAPPDDEDKVYMATLMMMTLCQTCLGPRRQRNLRSWTPKKSSVKKKLPTH